MKVTLTGDNSFMLHAELKKSLNSFLNKYGDMALERLNGDEASFERMQEALQSLPFLSDKKMVILNSPSSNKQFIEAAQKLLVGLPETTDVIIVEPKLDKRSQYYKLLKKTTDFCECLELERLSLAKWLAARAKEQSGHISPVDASYLIERVGASQQLLSNEIEKLLLYDPDITRKNIVLLTEATPQSTVFELLEAAFNGNMGRTMDLYNEQRDMKVEPQQIIAMLVWQLRVLALIKTAGNNSPQTIASEAKLNPFVVRKSNTIARNLTLSGIKKLVSDLLEIDVRLKQESFDADEALQNYLLAIAK